MITLHVVFHAHLDPIWMWPWTSGLDEALATARSACDRLDAHPDLFYTQGEAWSFAMIEQADPALFARVRAHVAAGRWEIVNGWWTQPDCNLPSGLGLRQQIQVGLDYIHSRFGQRPRCGFNPDTFGHAAILPELLRSLGQDRYVFMRPQEHEMQLPSRLFRWRTQAGGQDLLTWRIAGGYGVNAHWLDGVKACLTALPEGCAHAMVFCGMGNHGGGPTERTIAWLRSIELPNVRLQFSTVNRFFDAIEAQRLTLPEVVGELQHHAIGCYSVVRSVKTATRRAEHMLAQAAVLATPQDREPLAQAWQAVASHHFHDTMGGTALPSTYVGVADELGGAAATADRIAAYRARHRLTALPDDRHPRVVLVNASAADLSGWQEVEFYLEHRYNREPWRLIDERGAEIPFQLLHTEALTDPGWWWGKRRLLLRQQLPANQLRSLRQDLSQPPTPLPQRVEAGACRIAATQGATVDVGGPVPQLSWQGRTVTAPSLLLIDDLTDTWSHSVDRFGEGGEGATWTAPVVIDRGPLMASLRQVGRIGQSRLVAEWRVFADEPFADLLLEVHWQEHHRVLKLVVPHALGASRTDATPGMALVRPNSGVERPLGEWTELGGGLGVVCPDVFALDATPTRARLTLLRAPLMSHHDPHPGAPVRPTWSDQGSHTFRFRFLLHGATPERLQALAHSWSEPALVCELTRGMGPRDA